MVGVHQQGLRCRVDRGSKLAQNGSCLHTGHMGKVPLGHCWASIAGSVHRREMRERIIQTINSIFHKWPLPLPPPTMEDAFRQHLLAPPHAGAGHGAPGLFLFRLMHVCFSADQVHSPEPDHSVKADSPWNRTAATSSSFCTAQPLWGLCSEDGGLTGFQCEGSRGV